MVTKNDPSHIEAKCIKFAKRSDWDVKQLANYINTCLSYDDYLGLEGRYSLNKAKKIIAKFKDNN